ncbi:hypothetical protein NDU88_004050 [Pleurodeles waltl]|uniref:Uncharacterized protein n=1 Tax=Pleurodeles waltl TaxID=8319 RepID=A0AAV7TSV3_PLEWA|nr:hypothetical protein NDU88_004050 [Pleurodeles waltl]
MRPDGATRRHRAGGATPAGPSRALPPDQGPCPSATRAPGRGQPSQGAAGPGGVACRSRVQGAGSSLLTSSDDPRASEPQRPQGIPGRSEEAWKPSSPQPALSVLGAGASTTPRSVFPGRAAAESAHASPGSAGCPRARG